MFLCLCKAKNSVVCSVLFCFVRDTLVCSAEKIVLLQHTQTTSPDPAGDPLPLMFFRQLAWQLRPEACLPAGPIHIHIHIYT
jgi:hypothetical protein